MKKTRRKFMAFLLSAMLLVTGTAMGTSPVSAADKAPPASIVRCEKTGISKGFGITFNTTDESWFSAISSVKVSGTEYKKVSSFWDFEDGGSTYRVLPTDKQILIGEAFTESSATCIISADGYSDLTLTLDKTKHTATVVDSSSGTTCQHTGGTATCQKKAVCTKCGEEYGDLAPHSGGTATCQQRAVCAVCHTEYGDLADHTYNDKGICTVCNAAAPDVELTIVPASGFDNYFMLKASTANYVNNITSISVNGESWEKKTSKYTLNGHHYYLGSSDNTIYFNPLNYSPAVLKNGDIITIKSTGYQDINLKLTVNNGTGTITPVAPGTQPGDDMQLHVRLVGTFESALVNQKGYDAISGASTNVTQNKNSDASVEVAVTKKDQEPQDSDWQLLSKSDIRVKSKGSSVNIVNHGDSAKGNDSGMAGVYSVHDGSVTLAGTPAKVGMYDISVTITDELGRTATSNTLPFRIYSGEETLQDQLILDNCTKTADGKYMYDMEPWAIKNFTLASGDQTVIVPADLKAWYGSHTSGTYGELGYAVPEGSLQTQTLILPKGCNLTLVNMDILSSVKIIVQDGAKLTLRDSVIQGAVEVESGGTFSMNYNDYGEGEFLNGASINGKLILKDGSTLENAKIYSNTNNIANGSEARHNTDPVVVINGNVKLKGKVFLRGDEAPTGTDSSTGKSYTGQVGMQVNGTLTLEKDSVLAVFGGGKDATTSNGGDAIHLNGGTITGEGKLIAVGGDGHFGDGGNAVSGSGTISVKDAYLEGGASISKSNAPGKALGDQVKLSGNTNRNLIDGENATNIDYDNDTYWRDITKSPDLSRYTVDANAPGENPDSGNTGGNGSGDNGSGDNGTGENPGDNGSNGNGSNGSNLNGNAGNGTDSDQNAGTSSQTGDNATPILWAAIMLTALAALGTTVLYRRKQRVGK